jgi:hypothetical protein
MDISSINDGTVDTKSWLNPTVGTLRAKKIICDDIEGGGGGGGALALNSAVNPGAFPEAINDGNFIGGAAGYSPVSRLIPTSALYAANSSFEFECSGTLESEVAGTDNTSRPIFGIMVGDNFNQDTSTGLLGYTVLGLDGALFSQTLVWTYKLVATHVASATQGGLAFTWTSELSYGKNNATIGNSSGTLSRIAMGTKDLGVVTPVGDGVRFSMYIGNMDWGGTDTMTIVKYNHTFRRVA